jgi:hypothetical protein
MQRNKLIVPFFKYLFSRPQILLKALYHGVSAADRKDFVIKNYGFSNGLPEIDLLDLIPQFNVEIKNFTHLYGTSLPIDIALLKALAGRIPDCDFLEIGTWRGESISNMAEVCRSCYSVSLSDEEMKAIGYDEKYTRVQRFFSKNLPNVKHIEANSMTFDFSSLDKKFDLIFVDGDHRFDAVKSDTAKVFELLKDENSIIVWHDYAIQYEHIDWNVLAGILAGAPAKKRGNIFHVTNTLCAVYLPGNHKIHNRDFPSVPNKKFSISISGQALNS